jgi:hypothetical protein
MHWNSWGGADRIVAWTWFVPTPGRTTYQTGRHVRLYLFHFFSAFVEAVFLCRQFFPFFFKVENYCFK